MQETSESEGSPLLRGRIDLALGVVVSIIATLYIAVLITKPDQLFADDTYFYLQVAWNFGRGMGSTFNNLMPTNGYHPLWMLICAAVYHFVPDKLRGIHAVAGVLAILDVIMLLVVRRLIARVGGNLWPLAFALLIPFSFLSQLGTEGALSGMFLALLMLSGYDFVLAPSTKSALAFNLVAAFAVLSRLDNIFIVSFVWLGVWVALGAIINFRGRRLQALMLPLYALFWGSYLASNWIWFHTLQPISGLLKSSSKSDHALGANLPHTAWLALTIMFASFVVVALRRRDLFFRVIEVPFVLGVLVHALYIVLRMSSETRWTWYYTSWMLIAAVLLARAGSVLLAERDRLAAPLGALCAVLLAIGWIALSYHRYYKGINPRPPASFNQVVYHQAGIRRSFAYDQPGLLAYYSDVQIIPLDGLMGNLEFQHDLARIGIRGVAAKYHVEGFIGPSVPFNAAAAKDYCERFFLSAETLHCAQVGQDEWQPTSLDVYARVPGAPAGNFALDSRQVLWSRANQIAVWRIDPAALAK